MNFINYNLKAIFDLWFFLVRLFLVVKAIGLSGLVVLRVS